MLIDKFKVAAFAFAAVLSFNTFATPINTNVISVVDESGSMSGEHGWLSGMMGDLDTALAAAAGVDPFSAQYGLVGFGGGSGHLTGHTHTANNTLAGYQAATGGLLLNGGTEDGYSGMNTAFGHSLAAGAVRNIILVTDEDRDNYVGSLNYTNMLAQFVNEGALLNAVVNFGARCGDGSTALGLDSTGTGYKADGAGGFTTCSGAYSVGGSGSTIADYVNMAFATGGAAWDLNQLRSGGLTATSFTAAFVDVKVEETIIAVPAPAGLAFIGMGLVMLGAVRRRRQA